MGKTSDKGGGPGRRGASGLINHEDESERECFIRRFWHYRMVDMVDTQHHLTRWT